MRLSQQFAQFPKRIAHRGLSAFYPENTLEAFRAAAEKGIQWIECDIRLTRDEQLIVFHDPVLERTTNGTGKVRETDLVEIQSLDAGSWFNEKFSGIRVPTLLETLQLCFELNMGINIEIKPDEPEPDRLVDQLCRTLKFLGQRNCPDILLSSYSPQILVDCLHNLPDIPRGLVIDDIDSWEALTRLHTPAQITSLHAWHHIATKELVDYCQLHQLDILSFTINEEAEAKKLWSLGVLSVFSDNGFVQDET